MIPSRSADGGYVALVVLVMSGILAGLVSALLMVARPALGLARIGATEAAADRLVEGGLNAAGYLLFTAMQDMSEVRRRTISLREGTVRLDVIDESGRIDLNVAPPELLEGLFSAVNGKRMSPAAFSARVVDWRDEDEETTQEGAERDAYEGAGLPYGPPNRLFRSVEELRLLLGMNDETFDRLLPFVTVFSGSAQVDPLSAPREVLAALPDLSPKDITKILEARRNGVTDRAELSTMTEGSSEHFRIDPSGVYRVRAEARLDAGFTEAAEAVIIAPGDEKANYGVVAWSRIPLAAQAR